MKIELIKEIAELITKHGLTKVDYKDHELQINIEKQNGFFEKGSSNFDSSVRPSVGTAVTADTNMKSVEPAIKDETTNDEKNNKELFAIKSPIVGVFYQASSPESEPYVRIGDSIKKGDVVCIVEAMKMINEIKSPVDGTIANICVKNAEAVEFEQVLIEIEESYV